APPRVDRSVSCRYKDGTRRGYSGGHENRRSEPRCPASARLCAAEDRKRHMFHCSSSAKAAHGPCCRTKQDRREPMAPVALVLLVVAERIERASGFARETHHGRLVRENRSRLAPPSKPPGCASQSKRIRQPRNQFAP